MRGGKQDRRSEYRKEPKHFVKSVVEEQAQKAAEALDSDEGKEREQRRRAEKASSSPRRNDDQCPCF
jgi:hypothetical protein